MRDDADEIEFARHCPIVRVIGEGCRAAEPDKTISAAVSREQAKRFCFRRRQPIIAANGIYNGQGTRSAYLVGRYCAR
jgi:hypothetical protein